MCTMRGRLTAAQAVAELLTVRPGPVWSGVARVVAEHRHVRQDSERMGDLLYRHSQPYSCACVGNSIVLGVFPCTADDHAALRSLCAVWLAEF